MTQRHPNLLCIDDDDQSLEIRKILFEASGYRVLTARGGADGLRLFRSHPVDAVVLDYQMPEMNGGEVAVRMKTLRPQVPILMLSALPELPESAWQHVDGFVCKGESTARLLRIIEDLMARHDGFRAGPPSRFARMGIAAGVLMGKLTALFAPPSRRPQPAKPAKSTVQFHARQMS